MRVLVVWELGSGYGHVAQLPQLAAALRTAGHRAVFALRDLSQVEATLGREGLPLLQAPLWLPRAAGLPATANYAELLYTCGYLESERLRAIVRAWRELYALTEPDVVLLNHAPTALLSARGLGFRTLRFGTGFECPPAVSPLPGFGEQVPAMRLADSERRVTEASSRVCDALGIGEMSSFADLMRADETLLCTFAALDAYRDVRGGVDYLGPLLSPPAGVAPDWDGDAPRRVFAYLKSSHPDYQAVVSALAASRCRVLVHTPNLTPEMQRRFAGGRLQFCAAADMQAVSRAADLVVSHGGHGTTAATLLGGCMQLLLPMHPEQALNARGVVNLGAGVLHTRVSAREFQASLERVIGGEGYREAAAEFAAQHAHFRPEQPFAAIVRRVRGD